MRVDDRLQHLDRIELVCADPAREQLLLARFGIEAPALAAFHDRKRKRIVVVADGERQLVAGADDRVLDLVRGDEAIPDRAIRNRIA